MITAQAASPVAGGADTSPLVSGSLTYAVEATGTYFLVSTVRCTNTVADHQISTNHEAEAR
jgi:hypothetical protein